VFYSSIDIFPYPLLTLKTTDKNNKKSDDFMHVFLPALHIIQQRISQ